MMLPKCGCRMASLDMLGSCSANSATDPNTSLYSRSCRPPPKKDSSREREREGCAVASKETEAHGRMHEQVHQSSVSGKWIRRGGLSMSRGPAP
jgi:hypothetical protein